CRVEAQVNGFGVPESGVYLRRGNGNQYDVVLLANGSLRIRRIRGTTIMVLGETASGIADLSAFSTLSLQALGAGPVELTASVNGVAKRAVTDATTLALTAPGAAGMSTKNAGVWFAAFRLYAVTVNGAPDAGSPDAGPPDAGPRDAGPPDAGPPDAGPPDAGPPDAGPPDAGPPDGGPPDAGPPDAGPPDAGPPDAGPTDAGPPDAGPPQTGVLFSDDFNRTLASGLGPKWTIVSGGWRDNDKA